MNAFTIITLAALSCVGDKGSVCISVPPHGKAEFNEICLKNSAAYTQDVIIDTRHYLIVLPDLVSPCR